MVRVTTLEEAVRLVEDGERVVIDVDGKDVAIISVEELKMIEEREDRLDVEAVNEAHVEPEDCITLDEYLKKRAEPGPDIPFEEVKARLERRRMLDAKCRPT